MLSREPLYALADWAAHFDAALLGLPADRSGLFNDDRVGRCLDALFLADRATLMTRIVVQAVGGDVEARHFGRDARKRAKGFGAFAKRSEGIIPAVALDA